MDSPSKAKTGPKSKPKKRYVKPELTKISPSTAEALLRRKAHSDSAAGKMPRRIDKLRQKDKVGTLFIPRGGNQIVEPVLSALNPSAVVLLRSLDGLVA